MPLSHRVTSAISNLYSFSLHELMPCYCPMAFLNTSNPTSTTHCSDFLTPFSWVMHVQLTKKMKQHCALRFRAALIEISVHLLAFNLVVLICFPFVQTGISASRWARSDGPSRPVSRWSFAAPLRRRMSPSVSSRCRGSSAAHRWPWWAPVPCLLWAPIMSPGRPPVKWLCAKRASTCTCSSCSTCALKMPGSISAA